MTTPAQEVLGKLGSLANSPKRTAALHELRLTTELLGQQMRVQKPEYRPSEALHHHLTHPILQAKISDYDFMTRLGGDQLAKDMKDLPAYIKTIGFPGFEIMDWPRTIGQLYAASITPIGDGLTQFVYGFNEKGMERIERSLVPLFEKNLTDPIFQEDTVAIQEFLAQLNERRVPPLVVVGGLRVVTGGDFAKLTEDEIATTLRSRFRNVASDNQASSITPSEFDRNDMKLIEWITSLQALRRSLK